MKTLVFDMDETLVCSKFKSQINQAHDLAPFMKPDFEFDLVLNAPGGGEEGGATDTVYVI